MNNALKYYIDKYDSMLDFPTYYQKLFPAWDGMFPTLCNLHDDTNPSFSYLPSLNIWRCFGACATGGTVSYYHKKYLEKNTGGNVNWVFVLNDLKKMFPFLPEIVINTNKDEELSLKSLKAKLVVKLPEEKEVTLTNEQSFSDLCLNMFVLRTKRNEEGSINSET